MPIDDWMPQAPIREARVSQPFQVWRPLEVPPDLSGQGLLVGTSGFHYPDWAGAFYPPRSPREGFPFYQMYFSFLEINHTFLAEPDPAYFAELERRSRARLRYSVLVHRDISHKGTWDAGEGRSLMKKHAAAVTPLAEAGRFYSFLIQLDHGVERHRRVLDYLLAVGSAALEEGLDVHVEFRHRTWHQEPVLRALQDAGIGLCNPDLPALLPGAFPLRAYATTAKGYIRYSGQNAAAWDPESVARRSGAYDGRDGRDGRYDYLYSLEEVEERIGGQLSLLGKTGMVAAVYRNHVRAQSALNAVQNLFLAGRRIGS